MAREGLERLDGVASVDEDPDLANRTARVYLKKGRWLDPAQIAAHLKNLQIGASSRGVEATIDGTLVKGGEDFFLRIGGTARELKLLPLRTKIQQNPATRLAQLVSPAEANAYASLCQRFERQPIKRIRITGVLAPEANNSVACEVRLVFIP